MIARLASPVLFSVALATVVFGGGCGDGNQPAQVPGPVEVALGGTAPDGSGFVALAGDVSLTPGAQGGFHVWMKYRVTGGEPAEMVRIAYTIRRVSDGRLILDAGRQQELGPAGDGGYWELPSAIPAFMCPSPLGVQVQDQPMRFELEVLDMGGAPLAATQAEFTPHCPAGDQAAFCVHICSG